jgi:DNA excision repair protein ERCC-2
MTGDQLESFFQELIDRYVKWATTLARWRHLRNAAIRTLDFPFTVYRTGQRPMAVAVYRAIRDGGQAIIQASTGIGKTMAALFPAVKTMGEGHIDRIFFLTARNTGKASALKALGLLQERGLRLKRVSLTAKDHICFCPEATCNPDVCAYARGHFDRLPAAMDEAFAHDNLDRRRSSRPWPGRTGSVPLNFPWSFPGGRTVLSATITTPSIPVYI